MIKEIVIAGGCFWGVEEYYRRLRGIVSTKVGYAQGHVAFPTYEQVLTGTTNHVEACFLCYDDTEMTLEMILDHFFRIVNPCSLNRQGGDFGTQYRTGIYYNDDEEKVIIETFIQKKQQEYKQNIVVENEKLHTFYDAEEYHQAYLQKHPRGYCHVDFSKMKISEQKGED